jgi:homoserine acetyltransferase
LLYDHQATGTPEQKQLLCKPITILLASICEAVLFDFHMRIRVFTSEGVRNLARSVMDYVRKKKIDEFEKYIASAKKHDFFDAADSGLYEILDGLRKLRNRVHIQNSKNDFEPDERNAFSYARQVKAEKSLEKILKTMATKYARTGHVTGCVDNFVLPWKEHYR